MYENVLNLYIYNSVLLLSLLSYVLIKLLRVNKDLL